MISPHPDGVIVEVWVVPRSSRDGVDGTHDGALRVRTASPPADGEANRAVGRIVAAAVGGRRGTVVSGHSARRKQVLVAGVDVATAMEALGGIR